MSRRYALYYAPACQSELARFGETVLGRTATQPRTENAAGPHPDRARWLALTHSPAHYGFHATLKAPFELAEGRSLEELCKEVSTFAERNTALPLTGLFPRKLSSFTALTLQPQTKILSELAFRIVEHFEPFRRSLSDGDIQRRKSQPLTPRQLQLLEQFGYPYVAEEFRFHMTLTGPVRNDDQDFVQWLQDQYRQVVSNTPVLDQLAIYWQEERTAPFIRLQSHPLVSGS